MYVVVISLTKYIYEGIYAFNAYKQVLPETRSGIMMVQDESNHLNDILVPLICEQRQSIRHR